MVLARTRCARRRSARSLVGEAMDVVTRIRLHGGPGDGLILGIVVAGAQPPEGILYDPDAITVQDATAHQAWPDSAAYYTRAEYVSGEPWDYQYTSEAVPPLE